MTLLETHSEGDSPGVAVLAAVALPALFDALPARGYTVFGPTVRDGAIVVSELASADELPYGRGVDTEAGRYLAAIGILDRVLTGGRHADPVYSARRDGNLVIAVECTEPHSAMETPNAAAQAGLLPATGMFEADVVRAYRTFNAAAPVFIELSRVTAGPPPATGPRDVELEQT